MTDHAYPSADPADEDSLVGVLRHSFKKLLQQTENMLPARVVAFNRDKNRATVVPLVSVLTTDGRAIARAQVASVPVMQFGGGGVVLNFNLKPGDLGWIHANDRDISLFMQTYNASPPNTLRTHTFQDGVFIPEVMRGWVLAGEDATNAVLQTLDGNSRVSVGASWVKLAFGAYTVTLDATGIRAVVGGNSFAITPAGITITGPLTSNAGAGGAINLNGHVVNVGGVKVDGVEMGTHIHDDPQGGVVGGPHN